MSHVNILLSVKRNEGLSAMSFNMQAELENQRLERANRALSHELAQRLKIKAESRGFAPKSAIVQTTPKEEIKPKTVQSEIDTDMLSAMYSNKRFQERNGAIEQTFHLSDFGLSFFDLKATRILQEFSEPKRIVQKITIETPRLKYHGVALPKISKRTKRPNKRSNLTLLQNFRESHITSTYVRKCNSGTFGKPVTSKKDSRFFHIYESTLNFSGNVQACLDILQYVETSKTHVLNTELGESRRVVKSEHKLAQVKKHTNVFMYLTHKGVAQTFITQNKKIDYVSQFRKIAMLGIPKLDEKQFAAYRHKALSECMPVIAKHGDYVLTFVPQIDSKIAESIQESQKDNAKKSPAKKRKAKKASPKKSKTTTPTKKESNPRKKTTAKSPAKKQAPKTKPKK